MTNIYPVLNDNDINVLQDVMRLYAQLSADIVVSSLMYNHKRDVNHHIADIAKYAKLNNELQLIKIKWIEFYREYDALQSIDAMLWQYGEEYGQYDWQFLISDNKVSSNLMLTVYKLRRIVKNHQKAIADYD